MKSVEETMAAWVNITDKTNKEQVVILRLRKVPCVQEVATPFYIVNYLIKYSKKYSNHLHLYLLNIPYVQEVVTHFIYRVSRK